MNDRDLEIAARELCALRGADPDKVIQWKNIEDDSISETVQWVIASYEILDFMRIQEAMNFAKDVRKGLSDEGNV